MPNPNPTSPHLPLQEDLRPVARTGVGSPESEPPTRPPLSEIVPRGPTEALPRVPLASAVPDDLPDGGSDGGKETPSPPDASVPSDDRDDREEPRAHSASFFRPRGTGGASPALQLTLVVEKEGGVPVERRIVWETDRCRIGSHPGSDIILRDSGVSRIHCELLRDGTVWRIRDASSTSGTRLDSVRVRDAELRSTNVLEVGTSTLRIHVGPLREEGTAPSESFGRLVGTSEPMRKLFELLAKVSASDINVLIEGESGTGKELVASEIVRRSSRANKPFIVVDCGAISAGLVESELFGHVRGAFTGADRERIGAFEAADGGTVFLDEIGELPIELQPKLLRALEAREIRRVGESRVRRVDVRVISATNRGLEKEIERGRFREDLFFRLAVIRARVPALRERKEDLPLLVRTFLAQLGVPDEAHLFPESALTEMALHDWPGNVRELRNHVERSLVLRSSNLAGDDASPPQDASRAIVPFRVAKESVIEAFERAYLSKLLEAAGGNMSRAARMAGMDRMYLHRLTHKHGLRKGKGDGGSIAPDAKSDDES